MSDSISLVPLSPGYDLTPTMRDVNKKFSVRYFLNLVLVDEEDRRYFKQQVTHLSMHSTSIVCQWSDICKCFCSTRGTRVSSQLCLPPFFYTDESTFGRNTDVNIHETSQGAFKPVEQFASLLNVRNMQKNEIVYQILKPVTSSTHIQDILFFF